MILYKSLEHSIEINKKVYNLREIEALALDPQVGKKLREENEKLNYYKE
jgi:hypothetical protein